MFKRMLSVMVMLLVLSAPAAVLAEEAQHAPAADKQATAAPERVTKYWLGYFEKYGDSSRKAGANFQKVMSPEGTLSYRVVVSDYIAGYRGDMVPEEGTVEVWNPATGAAETLSLPVISHSTDGYGSYTFTFSLPNEVVDCQRENMKNYKAGQEKKKAVLSFKAHNHVGHHVPYECQSDFSFAFEYGM